MARTTVLQTRATEAERAVLDAFAEAAGITPSEVLRHALRLALKLPNEPDAQRLGLRQAADELSRVGRDLNQLVRRADENAMHMTVVQAAALERCHASCTALRDALRAYVRVVERRDVTSSVAEVLG